MEDEVYGKAAWDAAEMAELAPVRLKAAERLPEVNGLAFDWPSWYAAWTKRQGGAEAPLPDGLQVEAADRFQATIPWTDLGQSFFLYAESNGEPLQKGYPLRLYVPDGSSACLNVKSVVVIRPLYGADRAAEATYGFRTRLTTEEMRKGRRLL